MLHELVTENTKLKYFCQSRSFHFRQADLIWPDVLSILVVLGSILLRTKPFSFKVGTH